MNKILKKYESRKNHLKNEELANLIRELIDFGEPFSMLRFCDGEGLFAFSGVKDQRYKKACFKHWGEVPASGYRLKISNNIKKSYVECDVAGLPFNIENSELEHFCVSNFLHLYRKPVLFHGDIHLWMYGEKFFESIIRNRKIFYISCRNIDNILLAMGAGSVDRILISPQYRFEDIKPKIPFYKQTDDIENEIMKKDLSGTLCFLAAGVAGKQFGLLMRERGGMVIDLGSVADKWAGVNSRRWILKANEKGL